jgi:hypothetical protein
MNSEPTKERDGFHSVPDFSFKDGDAVECVPTHEFLSSMQQPAEVAMTLLTSAPTFSTDQSCLLDAGLLGSRKNASRLIQ